MGNEQFVIPGIPFGFYRGWPFTPSGELLALGRTPLDRLRRACQFGAWAIGASFRIPLGGENGGSFITVNAGYRKAMTDIEMAKGGYSFLTVGFGVFGRPRIEGLLSELSNVLSDVRPLCQIVGSDLFVKPL